MKDNKPATPGVVFRRLRSGMGVGTILPSLLERKPTEVARRMTTPVHFDILHGDTRQSVMIAPAGAGMCVMATDHLNPSIGTK